MRISGFFSALANNSMKPEQLIAVAFQEIAGKADKIGELNISPDLLRELLRQQRRPIRVNRLTENKIVLVVRSTRLAELRTRFATKRQAKFYVEHLGGGFL